jgi:amino acid permease
LEKNLDVMMLFVEKQLYMLEFLELVWQSFPLFVFAFFAHQATVNKDIKVKKALQ